MMKILFLPLFLIIILCAGCGSDSKENDENPQKESQVALYDKNKEAIAYIDFTDEATIFTFEGEPLAYIEPEEQVYGFNGKFWGWYSEGVVYDKTCYAVGARHGIERNGINTVVTRAEKVKSAKKVKPVKHAKEAGLARPVLKDSWSKTTLTEFFAGGKK